MYSELEQNKDNMEEKVSEILSILKNKFKTDDNQIRKEVIGRGRKSQVWLN